MSLRHKIKRRYKRKAVTERSNYITNNKKFQFSLLDYIFRLFFIHKYNLHQTLSSLAITFHCKTRVECRRSIYLKLNKAKSIKLIISIIHLNKVYSLSTSINLIISKQIEN